MLKKWLEYPQLLGINLKVKVNNSIEYLRVVLAYYFDPSFLQIDSSLVFSSLGDSPFEVSRQFLSRRGESDVYTYGETPLTTLDFISQQCGLSVKDTVFELGCGRGRTCFWLNRFIGCHVIGIDYVPAFIQRAQKIATKFEVKGIEFRLEDFLESDFSGATVIYLYGTCYSPSFIATLIHRLASLPKGTKVITVSYALTDYQSQPIFKLCRCFPARFTWGKASVYLQVRI